ncbi:hypothetical protein ACI65C_001560 [Semiaphis heraclei]
MYSHRSKVSRSTKFTTHAAVQLQRRHNNSTSNHYDSTATGQLLEDLNHKDSIQLKRLVHETFPTCNVNLIHVVNVPQMYGMYLLRKEEMQLTRMGNSDKERILFHVTTKSRAVESLKNGLDWRRTRRSKFGCGVSFSDNADYANYYADKLPKEGSRVIIVCAVLVNKTQRVSGNRGQGNLMVPPGNADTTVSPNGRVYVKYNDYEFYPLYFMYYQRAPEHLNESKYFRGNNPLGQNQQNNRAVQQQHESKAQREREEALDLQELRERAELQRVMRVRRELDQVMQNVKAHRADQLRRQEREQELEYSRQAQAPIRQRENNSICLIL